MKITLLNRIWFSVIRRKQPIPIHKVEHLVAYDVPYLPHSYLDSTEFKKTRPGTIEVRALTICDTEQLIVASTNMRWVARQIGRRIVEGTWYWYGLPREEFHEEREVTYHMLRTIVSHVSRVMIRAYKVFPPRLPPYVAYILFWESVEVPKLVGITLAYPKLEEGRWRDVETEKDLIAYSPEEYSITLGEPPFLWRYKQPDDIATTANLYDTYFTIDIDINDTKDYDKVVYTDLQLRYLRYLGIVDKFERYATKHGYHFVVRTKRPVNVYYIKFFLGDDRYRYQADYQRYIFTGVHDTLWNTKHDKNNEYLQPDKPPMWENDLLGDTYDIRRTIK